MTDGKEKVLLGRLASVYGVKGWLKVNSYTQPKENIFNYPEWQLKIEKQWQLRQVVQGRPHGKTLVVKLNNCEDRDQAKQLVGVEIAVYRDQLPETKDDEYYWSDLMGLQVIAKTGTVLGLVKEIIETGSNEVLVVNNTDSGKKVEYLIPWLQDDVIIEVSKNDNVIRVDWETDF